MELQDTIERLHETESGKLNRSEVLDVLKQLKFFLNRGEIRAAEHEKGTWRVNEWVKKGIILGFRVGAIVSYGSNGLFPFFDKDTMSLKHLVAADGARVVPGGTSIRDGVYIGKGVIVMPPAYINVGAYIDDDTLIDSHALVGSCAQIGKRVHLSAAAQIGGVLEPVGSMPVIVEDDVLVGGNCGVYEGTIVKKRAVLASGVILTGSTQVYDVLNERVLVKEKKLPLTIPENAVVVPGSRMLKSEWAASNGLSVSSPIIIKYRDEKTDAATALEEALR